MKRFVTILAVAGALAVIATWAVLGAHRGWTRMKIETKKVDPVTEIEYVEYHPGFIPGVDFLAAGLFGCAILFGAGMILARFQSHKP
jgi:hypothetical protein